MQDTKKVLDYQEKNKAKVLPPLAKNEQKMFNYILKYLIYQKAPLECFKGIPSETLIKGFGSGRYWQPLQSLEQKGYIQINHSYCSIPTKVKERFPNKKGFCKSYRINPNLFVKGFRFTDLQSEQSKRTSNRLLLKTADSLRQMVCNIPPSEIEKIVKNLVTDEYINDRYQDTELVEDGTYFFAINGNLSNNPLPKDKILEIAKKNRLDAIFCIKNRLFFVGNQETIKAEKKAYVTASYIYILEKFATGKQLDVLDRSQTNNRLTTLFTIFPNDLLKHLKFCGQDFRQLDISNSQFCILANLIKGFSDHKSKGLLIPIISKMQQLKDYYPSFEKCFDLLLDVNGNLSADVQNFVKVATDGGLYEQIALSCNLTRPQTKTAMFVVAFSQPQYNPVAKEKVRELYPSVLNFVDSVKRALPKKDKVCFAVLLQLIESYVCIDNTLTAIHKHKIKVLTRHDSFCVPINSNGCYPSLIYNELTRLLPYGFNLKTSWNYEL